MPAQIICRVHYLAHKKTNTDGTTFNDISKQLIDYGDNIDDEHTTGVNNHNLNKDNDEPAGPPYEDAPNKDDEDTKYTPDDSFDTSTERASTFGLIF